MSALFVSSLSTASPLALVGGTLIDGTGAAPINDSVVLIDGERVIAAGRRGDVRIPTNAAILSTQGLTLLPGLIDVAVHLDELGHGHRARWHDAYGPLTDKVVLPVASRALIGAGVTTARDIGARADGVTSLRRRIDAGRAPGPSLLTSGSHIGRDGSGRDHLFVAKTATELRQSVERLAAGGADLIILEGAADYTAGELSTLHFAAEDAGLKWYAWVGTDADIAPAVRAGAHGLISMGNDFHETLPADALAALAARAAAGRPVYWAAGASVLTNHEWLRQNNAPLFEPRWKVALPPIVAEELTLSLSDLSAHPIDLETPTLRRSVLSSRMRSARAAGAHFLVGSLAGEPGHIPSRATWQEAEALVTEAGYTTTEALRAVTLDAAFALGRDAEIGSITPGKFADLVVVRGDIMRDIGHLADVRMVIHHGARFTPSTDAPEEETL